MYIQEWLFIKLKDISETLSGLVRSDPQSFNCGFNTGYKQALIDLDNIIFEGSEFYCKKCRTDRVSEGAEFYCEKCRMDRILTE